jgi:hypothetical protein
MSKHYVQQEVAEVELSSLVTAAEQEEEGFFQRNPHLIELYRSRLIAVALCQGAALQYIGRGYGVIDFDVHFFYAQNATKPRLSRAVKSIWTSIRRVRRDPS